MLRPPQTFAGRITAIFLFTAASAVLLLTACTNTDCIGSDVDITEYLAARDSLGQAAELQGLYYIIDAPGDTVRPQLTDTVLVTYRGTLTDAEETVFDETGEVPVAFLLNDLIAGWQIGLPLIGQGGSIRLFVPSRLAYASSQAGNLCPGSDIVFDIDLLRVR